MGEKFTLIQFRKPKEGKMDYVPYNKYDYAHDMRAAKRRAWTGFPLVFVGIVLAVASGLHEDLARVTTVPGATLGFTLILVGSYLVGRAIYIEHFARKNFSGL